MNFLLSALSYALRSYQKLYSKNIFAERKISQSVRYIYLDIIELNIATLDWFLLSAYFEPLPYLDDYRH